MIVVCHDITLKLKNFFKENTYNKIAVLADENTEKLCYPIIKESLPPHEVISIHSGEINKNLNSCQYIWTYLSNHYFDRKALLINLGGGVIGDMGGFCASVYKRGIAFLNIPTTLLAQVDASIGGKLGIDFLNYKNQIGIFNSAKATFIDPVFFNTLPLEHINAGFMEIIKHALIADKAFWEILKSKNHLRETDWSKIIKKSIGIKENIVTQDPFEKGLRKILNFGHTIGHALESYFLKSNTPWLHGEAIGLGMVGEAYLSTIKSGLPQNIFSEIKSFISQHLTFKKIKNLNKVKVAKFLYQDKKNQDSNIMPILLKDIGKPILNQYISIQESIEAIDFCTDFVKKQTCYTLKSEK